MNSNSIEKGVVNEKQNEAPNQSQPSQSKQQPSAVDGGLKAWSTVTGCFLAFFASFGFVTAFGVFQSYYESILPDHSPAEVSWIGSFQLWCITGMAIPSIVMNAHLGLYWTLAVSTFLTFFGVMMASLSTLYYQFLLSHGVCTGIGIGLTFLPVVTLPNQWFSKRRGLAVGIAIGGSSVGGVVWPIVANQLLNVNRVGYPWTMRTIGFIQLVSMLAAAALIRNKIPHNKAVNFNSFPFKMALSQVGVCLMAFALLLHFFGVYIPYFYAPLYAEVLGAPPRTSFYISSALNASTFFGRLVMGILADKIGSSNTLVVSVLASAVLSFAWQGVRSVAGMFVWAVVYGWFSGASISLQSPAMIPLVPGGDLRLIGPYIAILCQISSFGSLGGNPIAGALVRLRARGDNGVDGSYNLDDFYPMMWFGGSVLFAAMIFYQLARYTHTPNMLSRK